MSSGLQQKACHAETGTLNFFDLFNFFLLYANGESQFKPPFKGEYFFYIFQASYANPKISPTNAFLGFLFFFGGPFVSQSFICGKGTLNHGLSKMQDVILVEFSKLAYFIGERIPYATLCLGLCD